MQHPQGIPDVLLLTIRDSDVHAMHVQTYEGAEKSQRLLAQWRITSNLQDKPRLQGISQAEDGRHW